MSKLAVISRDKRQFIRHPSDIPIEYLEIDRPPAHDPLNDIGVGGLSFCSDHYIKPGIWLKLHIPMHEQHFDIEAKVRWCNKKFGTALYHVGAVFKNKETAFSARMVEQICHIEQYKKDVLKLEGRDLSGDEAAQEWIEKYANAFAQHYTQPESKKSWTLKKSARRSR